MKKALASVLKILSRLVLKVHRPYVVAVTGSYGKTTTKDFIYEILKEKYFVWRSEGNLNTELGLPLAIAGVRVFPEKKIFKWIFTLARFIYFLLPFISYPKYLVLEMGADKPGDISYLLSIAQPKISVITAVGPTHLHLFGSVENVLKEKVKLIYALPPEGVAVINKDSYVLYDFITKTDRHYLTYSTASSDANIYADNIEFIVNTSDENIGGTKFDVCFQEKRKKIYLKGVVGIGYIYASLAAIGVALHCGFTFDECANLLSKREIMVKDRMILKKYIKGSIIINDVYNSSPDALRSALSILSSIKWQGRKIAVLGDMLELGVHSQKYHIEAGKHAADVCDMVIGIGEEAKMLVDEAGKKLGEEKVKWFPKEDLEGLKQYLYQVIAEDDLVLMKASRGIHLERII